MRRRSQALVLMATALLIAGGCGREEPSVSREVTPNPSRSSTPSTLDPNAPTRAPRAIATH
ncbi:MAG: hypothetical protein AB7I30_11340 [Isosphaeraceae bacterium]